MAKIDTPNIEVGVGGTDYSTPYIEPAQDFSAQKAVNIAETGLESFKIFKKASAASQAKTLLDKFTQSSEKQSLAEDHIANLEREEDAHALLNRADSVGGPAFTAAHNELAQVERAKDQLNIKKAAMDQGLMSYDQYRREAEMLFYQQIALTPGLKEEIAGVMGEYLGIDPRGQTAAIEIEHRKAAMKQGREELATQISSMQGMALWDDGMTREENLRVFGPAWRKRVRAHEDNKRIMEELNKAKELNDAEKAAKAAELTDSLVTTKLDLLRSMGTFQGISIDTLTPHDVLNLDENTRLQWMAQLEQTQNALASQANIAKAKLGDHFDVDVHMADVENRVEHITKLLSGKLKEEDIKTQLAILTSENDITIELEKQGMMMDRQSIVRLAAMNDLLQTDSLVYSAETSFVIAEMLNGKVSDLTNMTPEQKAEIQKHYDWSLQKMYLRKDWSNPAHVTDGAQLLARMSQHMPDELTDVTRRHMLRMTSHPEFIEAMRTQQPREYQILQRNIQPHVMQLEQNQSIRLQTLSDELRLKSDDFFLKKEDETWMLLPTKDAMEPVVTKGAGPAAKSSKRLSEVATEQKQAKLSSITSTMNSSTSTSWTDLVKSRAVMTNISESEAARQLSIEMGISPREVKIKPNTGGFADEFKPTDQGTDDDFQPETETERPSPLTKIEDGTYEINGQLVEIKNGAIVDQ